MSQETQDYLLMLALTVGVGALIVALGTWQLLEAARRLRMGVRVVATIVGYEREVPEETDHYGDVLYYPVVEFTDTSGATQRVRTGLSGAQPLLNVGTRVKIVYKANDLRQTNIATFRETWAVGIVLTTMGLVWFSIGIWLVT